MRVTIKGLTDSTITFNTTGIILRGNSAKPELYPNSIARHIDIKNEDQMRELITLKNAKLISVIDEDLPLEKSQIQTPITSHSSNIQPIIAPRSLSIKETNIIPSESIEDMPSPYPKEEGTEEELLTIPEGFRTLKTPKKKTNRTKKTAKTEKTEKTEKKAIKIKPIKHSKNFGTPIAKDSQEDDSKIVVMTTNGPVSSKAMNNMAGEIAESEATQASIEALRQLEAEEDAPESLVDESKLNESEKMGGITVIATGENSVKKIAMKNSILPEADAIKNRGIKFIDPNGDGPVKEGSDKDQSFKNVFIDDNDDNDNDNMIES